MAVGAIGVPVKAGDSSGALSPRAELNPVLTMDPATLKLAFNDTSPALTTEPVKDGEARGALSPRALVNPVLTIMPLTKRLPLNELSYATRNPAFIETSPADSTIPLKDGDADGATKANMLVNSALTMDPPINRLALKDESDATRNPAFKDTSPALTTEPVKDGDASGALRASAELNPVFTMDPPT